MTVREALAFFAAPRECLTVSNCSTKWAWISSARPACDYPVRRRGSTSQNRLPPVSAHGSIECIYILDEPTTGLHFDDIAKLLAACRKLIRTGAPLLVIEHNLDVIKTADWIIDLGPEGGEAGGEIVTTGTPEQIAQVAASHTGRYLRDALAVGRANAYGAAKN